MNEEPSDSPRNFSEVLRHLIEEAFSQVRDEPGICGFKIVIQGMGGFPGSNQEKHAGLPALSEPAGEVPAPEVVTIDDEVKVVIDLPGADRETISLGVDEDTLEIRAEGVISSYRISAPLPPVEADSMRSSYRNGVLEVTFARSKPTTSG